MPESGKDMLLSLLSGSGRELVNFKFFPGDKVSSGDELCAAAYNALSLALDGKGTETIPGTGREPVQFGELIAAL